MFVLRYRKLIHPIQLQMSKNAVSELHAWFPVNPYARAGYLKEPPEIIELLLQLQTVSRHKWFIKATFSSPFTKYVSCQHGGLSTRQAHKLPSVHNPSHDRVSLH